MPLPEAQTPAAIVEFSYYFSGILAVMVAAAAVRVLLERPPHVPVSPRAMMLVAGIALSWAAGGVQRLVTAVARDAGWNLTGWPQSLLLLCVAGVVAGSLMHLRTFTAMKCGVGAWWRVGVGAAVLSGGLVWAF